MKRLLAFLASVIAVLAVSLSAFSMFTAHCENGNFNVQTVDVEFFGDDTDEANKYFQELEQMICAEHGSVPREH